MLEGEPCPTGMQESRALPYRGAGKRSLPHRGAARRSVPHRAVQRDGGIPALGERARPIGKTQRAAQKRTPYLRGVPKKPQPSAPSRPALTASPRARPPLCRWRGGTRMEPRPRLTPPARPPACGHGHRASDCACAARPGVVRSDVISGGGRLGDVGDVMEAWGTMGTLLGSWW